MGCGNSKSTRVENAPFPVIKQTKPVAAEQEKEGKISEQPESGTESSGKDKQTTDSKPEKHGPLTPKQILIVQNTWGIVKGSSDLQQIGIEFYVRLFTDSPELLQLFSFRDIELSEDVLRSDARFKKQSLVTMQHVDLAVTSLNDLGSVVPALKDLGARHSMYKVEEHHYGPVGAALLSTLEKGLGENFTSEAREAWTTVYGVVSDTMKEGAKEIQAV
ncbi:unnamed protein product [Porites lobata]|uniref:Globin domain-containing protein n=1 Tax=Porites lobata TaxID=104759 RepID=A0ABN8N374_9CNID|nr:unnamed protein product [Porites lobata]